MVGRTDDDDVEVVPLEQAAVVAIEVGTASPLLLGFGGAAL